MLAGINLTQAQEEEVAFLIENHREDLGRTGTFLNREWFVDGVTNDQFGWHIYSVESTQDTFRDMNRIIRNIKSYHSGNRYSGHGSDRCFQQPDHDAHHTAE